jgi:hypothetical protein
MPYGEVNFEDEDDILHTECEFCGYSDGHDPDCLINKEDYDDVDDGDGEEDLLE